MKSNLSKLFYDSLNFEIPGSYGIIFDLLDILAKQDSSFIQTDGVIKYCFESICKIHGLNEKEFVQLISNNTDNHLYPKRDILCKSGILNLRTILSNYIISLFNVPVLSTTYNSKSIEEAQKLLKEKGYVIIYNAIPEKKFKKLRKEAEIIYETTKKIEDFWKGKCLPGEMKANFSSAIQYNRNKEIAGPTQANQSLYEYMRSSDIIDLVSDIIGVPPLHKGTISEGILKTAFYQTLHANNLELLSLNDEQTQLHCDSFHPIFKVWIYLNDVNSDQSNLCISPSSHKVTKKRLHYETYLNNSILNDKNELQDPSKNFAYRFHNEKATEFGYKINDLDQLELPANSLVLVNTRAFHCRTKFKTYKPRNSIYFELRPLNPLSLLHFFGRSF